MTEPPRAAIETEIDAKLARSHTTGLSFVLQRAIAACALLLPDDQTARMLQVAEGTVRGQVARAESTVFAFLEVKRDRTHLGRWAMFHWNCCLGAAARRLGDDTLFDPRFDGPAGEGRSLLARLRAGIRWRGAQGARSPAAATLSWAPLRPSLIATAIVVAWALLALGGVHALMSRESGPHELESARARAMGDTDGFAITPRQVPTRSGVSILHAAVGPVLPAVSYEEVEEAIGEYLTCAEENGYIPHPWPGEGLRLTRPIVEIPNTADLANDEQGLAVGAAHKTLTECQREHMDDALTAWNVQVEPSEAERLQVFEFMRRCVTEGGRPGTERPGGLGYATYPSGPQLDFTIRGDQLRMWGDCAWALEAETGFRAPLPPAVD
jgi:hypothetical protein